MNSLIEIKNLNHKFSLTKKIKINALEDVSLSINKGEIFGLVGESGAGKSTLARCLMNIYTPSSGEIFYSGINTCDKNEFRKNRKFLQTSRQIVFQDSASSLNPRMSVSDIITEPLVINKAKPTHGSYRDEAAYLMELTGLSPALLESFPNELSGGQRQRVAICRALALDPTLLVADEPIASLDVSIQAQIVNLFLKLQRERGFTLVFIAHDLAMVEFLCDRVGVMYQGHLVEVAPSKELFSSPMHEYTKALLSAIPIPDPVAERNRIIPVFDGIQLGKGEMREVLPGHFVRCERGDNAI